ncbi:MAG: 2-keto-4-pentenoate hydratase [Pseudomonadota bacterium]
MADTTFKNPVSERFVTARMKGASLQEFPGELPTTIAEAYAIQDESIRHWPDDVAGWKVGGVPPTYQEQFNATRLAGPIFKSKVSHTDGPAVDIPVFDGGFAAVEGEIVLQIARTVTPGTVDPQSDEVLSLVGAAHFGIEIAASPFIGINDLGPMSIISDFGNNGALIVGQRIDDWATGAAVGRGMRVVVDGEEIGAAKLAPLEDGAIGALRFLLANCEERGITLAEGTYVSTGAVTGVHQASIGAVAEVHFEGTAPIHLTLSAMTKQA